MHLDNYSGTYSNFTIVRNGASVFYGQIVNSATTYGLVVWDYGVGRVAMFSTTNGPTQMRLMGRLFSNTVYWAARENLSVWAPTSVQTLSGELFSGDLESLAHSEDVRYCVFGDPDVLGAVVEMWGTLSGGVLLPWHSYGSRRWVGRASGCRSICIARGHDK